MHQSFETIAQLQRDSSACLLCIKKTALITIRIILWKYLASVKTILQNRFLYQKQTFQVPFSRLLIHKLTTKKWVD